MSDTNQKLQDLQTSVDVRLANTEAEMSRPKSPPPQDNSHLAARKIELEQKLVSDNKKKKQQHYRIYKKKYQISKLAI